MTRTHAVALALALAFAHGRGCAVAEADDGADALLVARIGLSEAPRDTLAIAHVLSERAAERGVSVREAACAYAPRSCGRRPYVARPWIPNAHPDRGAPIGWPGVSSWERTRTLLAALTVVADRGLRGIDPTPCAGAIEWGAPTCAACRRRMRRAGFVRVECDAANHFWMRGER